MKRKYSLSSFGGSCRIVFCVLSTNSSADSLDNIFSDV